MSLIRDIVLKFGTTKGSDLTRYEEDDNSLNWVPNQEAFFLVGSWLRPSTECLATKISSGELKSSFGGKCWASEMSRADSFKV